MQIVIVFQLAPGKRLRQFVLACASACFFIPLVPDLRSAEWFLVMLVVTYAALLCVRAWPRGGTVAAAITVTVLALPVSQALHAVRRLYPGST